MTSVEEVALKVAFVSATLSGFSFGGYREKEKKKSMPHIMKSGKLACLG